MKIYITNLPWSKDRRTFMKNQLNRLGIPHDFFDCVIGANLSEEELSTKCNMAAIEEHNKKRVWFNKGIIGCTLTNQNIYKDIINKDIEYALYLEDDTVLPNNFKDILSHIESFIKQGDVVLLFFMAWQPLKLAKSNISSPFTFNYCIPVNPKVLTGGSAYVVTKEAARKMLEVNTPIHVTPDSWGYYIEKDAIKRLLCASPIVVDTADFKSTMQLGKMKQITNFINQHKIFPFFQILKMRRRNMKKNKQKFIIEQ